MQYQRFFCRPSQEPSTSTDARGQGWLQAIAKGCTGPLVTALQEALWSRPGTAEVRVRLIKQSGTELYRLGVRAAVNDGLAAALTAIVGSDAVALAPGSSSP